MNQSSSDLKRKKLRRKRRQAIQRAVCMAGLMVVIVAALRTATDYLLAENTLERKEDDRVQAVSAVSQAPAATSVAASEPIERLSSQIYADLEEYAKTNETAAKIYENRRKYPEVLLAAYLNNPEMEQFVDGYLNRDETLQNCVLIDEEKQQKFPLLLQWDPRWGYLSYGGSMIGLSGCGPTCLSMTLIALTGHTDQTPDKIADFSETNGYYVEGSGTAWSLMTEGAAQLGLSAQELSLDEHVMQSQLDAGRPIICSMGAGDFTTQGHFIMIYGYDEQGFLVNDPNCIARSRQSWPFERLQRQIKNLWAYAAY